MGAASVPPGRWRCAPSSRGANVAGIAVRRKGRVGRWLVALLLFALVMGLGLVAASACGALAGPGLGRADVVTDVPLGKPDKLDDLVGKHAELRGLRVLEVVGDKAFWIGRDADERIIVYLEEEKVSGQAVEGGVAVRAGQVVDLYATITRLPSPEQIRRQWDLTPSALEAIRR